MNVNLFPGGGLIIPSPLSIAGCIAWYDAADAASVTIAAGQPAATSISQLNDKSGNAFTLSQISPSALRPIYVSAVQNGKNIIRFAGASVLGGVNFTTLGGASGWTMFCVNKPLDYTRESYLFKIGWTLNNVDTAIQFVRMTSGFTEVGGSTASGNTPSYVDDTTVQSLSAFEIHSVIAILGGNVTIYSNGVQTKQTGSFLSGTVGAAIKNFFMGAGGALVPNTYAGDIGEQIVYNSALSLSDHAKVVAYLKAKWAL